MSYYLKPNVVIEPLVANWYAWAHLISPATAAMNVTHRHLPILESFIESPETHEEAVKNPKMKGGPFMDIPQKQLPEVNQLRDQTRSSQQNLISLSKAIRALNSLLLEKSDGYSLNELYKEIPGPLKGLVELTYDLNGNASFRFFESLLYKSEFYDKSFQSIQIWETQNDERPFVLSTPRIGASDKIHLDLSFDHPAIDLLGKMRREAHEIEEVLELIDVPAEQLELFKSFFKTDPPPQYANYDGDKIRMRYFGHACVLLETQSVSVLVDPLISYYGYPQDVNRFSDMDLPEHIDFVLITHNHQDHILFETLLPLRSRIGKIIVPRSGGGFLRDPSLKMMFEAVGFDNVEEISDMERIIGGNCEITGIPFLGEHGDLNIQSKSCYHLLIEEFSVILAADSCNISPEVYQKVHAEIGDIDVLMLGMECDGAPFSWLYGPLMFEPVQRDMDFSRRLAGSNYDRGVDLVQTFNAKEVYVYAMGMEPWLEFISSIKYTDESNPIIASNHLVETCRSMGVTAERLFGEKELLYAKSVGPELEDGVFKWD